jgi:hypothetical protein
MSFQYKDIDSVHTRRYSTSQMFVLMFKVIVHNPAGPADYIHYVQICVPVFNALARVRVNG